MRKISYVSLIIIFGVFLLFVAGCGDFWSTDSNSDTNTSDTTSPSVSSQSPASGATGVSVKPEIYATFSEPAYFGSVSLSSSGGSVTVNPEQPSPGYTIYLKRSPERRLDYGVTYTASITGVKDGSGNSLGTASWSFTTAYPSFNIYTTPDSHNYDVGKYNSIDIYGDKKYIAYQDTSDCSLRIISTATGTSFDGPYTIESPSQSGECFGKDSSMTIDGSGTVHVVYLHERPGLGDEVKYASASTSSISGTWSKTTIYQFSNTSDTSIYADTTTDSNNKVHISFYDQENTALRYATNKNSTWQTVIADNGASEDDPGKYTSIKVDDSGYIHMSYYDYHSSVGNGNLKYVRGYMDDNGNWTSVEGPLTLDSTGEVGKYTSMALYNGTPYITYYDGTNSRVKLITNASGDWEAQTVVSISSESALPFFIEGSTGIMHLSYISNGTLYYLSKSWNWSSPYSVDTGISSGIYTSIVVDGNGKAYISYYDATDQDLKYAHPTN